jgi:hypothetical protein
MGISTQHYHPSMIGKVQFFFETMDPTHDCEMFLSDDRRKGTESLLKDEYIPAMVLKNCWPTQSVKEAKKRILMGFMPRKGRYGSTITVRLSS